MNQPLSRRSAWIALGSAFLFATTALAQLEIGPPTPADGGGSVPIAPPTPVVTETRPAATNPAANPAMLPSAESVLQELLNNKSGAAPGTPGTAPGAAGAPSMLINPVSPPLGADGLLREGQQIDMRNGHLQRDEAGAMMFVFDDKETPAYPAMGLVPSRRLAAMEDAAGFSEALGAGAVVVGGGAATATASAGGADMNFRITAEVTQYRGKNYLYIKPSGVPVPPPAVKLPAATQPLVDPIAPNVPQVAPVPQGNIISNRVGRLVRDVKTGTELFVFDADGKKMTDPPMGVIPCKYLAVIEDATDKGNKPLKFKLSGEITTYRGKNYLYVKFVQQVRDMNGGLGTAQ